ncbi:MAG TPA: hypothetical protein VF593_04665 [Chthoniobacteraceae bacterium]|jgi:hypothetical protein
MRHLGDLKDWNMRSPTLVRSLWLLVGMVLFWGASSAEGALPAYWFDDFEATTGWKQAAFTPAHGDMQLVQGTAAVVAKADDDSAQVLELGPSFPFAAVFVATTAVAKAPVVFCEVLAQPVAVGPEEDAEFLDFGGAIAGFFRNGDSAEVRVLFARTDEESVWISTGQSFAVEESGRAVEWLRVAIRLDRRTERWSLRLNGVEVLNGLRALPGEAAGLPLWLYGQEQEATRFDDLLVTTVEPNDLEKIVEWRQRRSARSRTTRPGNAGAKMVSRAAPSREVRSRQPAIREVTQRLAAPTLRAWKAELRIGDATFHGGPEVEIEGRKTSLLIYSPRSDEEGRPLPGTLTITADAQLRPGVDLSGLRWMIAEMKGGPHEIGGVVNAGDFSTGLVQTATIPVEWIRQATSAWVWAPPGEHDAKWLQFRQEQERKSVK